MFLLFLQEIIQAQLKRQAELEQKLKEIAERKFEGLSPCFALNHFDVIIFF
jgi:hypothetical protein